MDFGKAVYEMAQGCIKTRVIALKVSTKRDKNQIMVSKLENKEEKYMKGSLRIINVMA